MKIRKKPIIVEGYELCFETIEFLVDNAKMRIELTPENKECNIKYIIPTLEGEHIAKYGDIIIKGVCGEWYPCKRDIFYKTYEVIEE